ncbi:hypothetical protein C0J52_06249 [Blattella germanica]|nr:hypothetical protein C0J52_06249 [Blattella germanica]
MFLPVSLSEITVASSILDLTSKFKESAIVSAIPLPKISTKINIFTSSGAEYEGTNSQISPYDPLNPVITADEAIELPPVDLTVNGGEGHKVYKEVYNRSRRSSNNSRSELLDRIGAQQYEDVLFKPKHRRKKNKTRMKKSLASGTESGSDTMSTNSIRSTSDGEEPWSSEKLDISSDWSASTRANKGRARRSSSEETLVRLGDCISSDVATLLGDISIEQEEANASQKCRDKRPSDLSIGEECVVPPEIQPDLRSPATIERDVISKERILAKELKLDSLFNGDDVESEKGVNEEHSCKINKIETTEFIGKKTSASYVTSHGCLLSEELSHDMQANDREEEMWGSESGAPDPQDEKLASLNSILSYGPPSGSSAPPSNHGSLEIYGPPDLKPEPSCENGPSEPVERAYGWNQYKVPETVTDISVCKHYVCCVDSRGIVHFSALNGLALKWQKVDYKAKQVSASPSASVVWKIQNNIAYALESPTTKGPFGKNWTEAAHSVQWVSVDDSMAWFVSDGCVLVQKQLGPERPCSGASTPVRCPMPITRVCCFLGSVIALTCTGELLVRTGISHIVPEGKDWKKVITPHPVVVDLALGCSGTGWVVDQKGGIHFSCDLSSPTPQWWQVLISEGIYQPKTPMQQFRNKLTENYLSMRQQSSVTVAASEDTVWVADKSATSIYMNKTEFTGEVFGLHHSTTKLRNGRTSIFHHHMASLKWAKVCAEGIYEDKGQLWLLSTAGDLFSSWPNAQTIHGLPLPEVSPIVSIAAAMDTVWILNAKGKIYIRQGISNINPDGTVWKPLNLTQIDGIHLTNVSCGCDVVWACDDQGDMFMAIGPPHSMAGSTFSPVWIPVDDKSPRKNTFTKVCVGPQMYMVWALDNKRNVYVREGVFTDYQIGTGWVLVSGIEAVELSISGSAVWALSPRGSIYRRYGITEENFIGEYWKKIPGCAISLTGMYYITFNNDS